MPLGRRHVLVEQFAQLIGETVQLLGREGAFGRRDVGRTGRRAGAVGATGTGPARPACPARPSSFRAVGLPSPGTSRVLALVTAPARHRHPGPRPPGGARQAQQLRQPLLPRKSLGRTPLPVVGALGGDRRVRRAGGRQLGAGLGG
ncbi:hypothetical protein STRIP9103_01396, partial [Streptomyces ipomoeae 91-03]